MFSKSSLLKIEYSINIEAQCFKNVQLYSKPHFHIFTRKKGLSRVYFWPKVFRQMWHSKFVKNGEWLSRMWTFRCCFRLNNFPQCLHENWSVFIWTSEMCLMRFSSLLNALLQLSHLNLLVDSSNTTGFLFPFNNTCWWTFLWCLFICFLAILSPHSSHFGFFSSFLSLFLFLCSRYSLNELNSNLHPLQNIVLFSSCLTDAW